MVPQAKWTLLGCLLCRQGGHHILAVLLAVPVLCQVVGQPGAARPEQVSMRQPGHDWAVAAARSYVLAGSETSGIIRTLYLRVDPYGLMTHIG